jgi:hypothetical protein
MARILKKEVMLPHTVAAWQQARRGVTRHGTAELGSAQRKYHFIYCCIIAGTCFEVTVLAWCKYAIVCTSNGNINGLEIIFFSIARLNLLSG